MRTVYLAVWSCLILAPALVGVMLPLAASARERPALLTGDIIEQIVPGTTVHLDTPLGSVVPIKYGEDGTLMGSAGVVAFHLGAARDRGRWWVENSRLCHKWNIWFDGKKSCLQIRRSGSKIYWRQDDGETGTATIVAQRLAGRIRPPPPRPVGLGGPKHAVVTPPPLTAQTSTTKRAPTATKKPDAITALLSSQKKKKSAPTKAARLTYRVVRVQNDDVLNIRRDAGVDSPVLGEIPPNGRGIIIIGTCIGDWCPIDHKGTTGWVNRVFLANDEPARAALPRPSALGGPLPRADTSLSSRSDIRQNPRSGTFQQARHQAAPRHFNQRRWRPNPTPIHRTFRVVRVQRDDVLNLRRDPTASSPVVATLSPLARGIRIIGACIGDWCPIEHRRRYGWANRFYIAQDTRPSR